MDWQPIETAPKDGARFLAYRSGFAESMAVVWFRDGEFKAVNGWLFPEVTLWQPLPPPPSEDK